MSLNSATQRLSDSATQRLSDSATQRLSNSATQDDKSLANSKIFLNDILHFSESELKNTKIRFNKDDEDWSPIDLFKIGNIQKLLDGQYHDYSKSESFKEGMTTIGFARIPNDGEQIWLLFHIGIVTKSLHIKNGPAYEYEEVEKFKPYFGRLIVKYHNPRGSQNLVRKALPLINEIEVVQILPEKLTDDFFPGYENVNVSFLDLKRLVKNLSWKTALENQKGVYLLADSKTGKMYVGSAYGEDMLLQRWSSYLKTGHGGDKKLKQLSFEYIQENFRFSILEIFSSRTDTNFILQRESWWKEVLLTRKFGYNGN